MSEVRTSTSPIVSIAAIAVVIFSVVGVGVMTGLIPSSRSTVTTTPSPEAKPEPAPVAKAPPVRSYSSTNTAPKKTATQVASNETASAPPVASTPVQSSVPTPVPAPAPVAAPAICYDCGVVDAINVAEQKGQGSGLGAAGGAVVGGLLGHQIGNGRGNTVATVAGAVGGALAGNEVEKRVKSTKRYTVSVRMDDGNFKSFSFDTAPAYSVGEKVKVIDGRLVRS